MDIKKDYFSTIEELKELEKSTPTNQERESIWSILLNYIQNERNSSSLGHFGLREEDIVQEDGYIFYPIDLYSDLDKQGNSYVYYKIYSQIVSECERTWKNIDSLYDTDISLWNDSLQWMLEYIIQHIDPYEMEMYEKTGILAENEDGSINTSVLKSSIPVTYEKEKLYLYPDLTGDNTIKIIYDENVEEEVDWFDLDDYTGSMFYDIYSMTGNEIRDILFSTETIKEAAEKIEELLKEENIFGYSYPYFYKTVIGANEHMLCNSISESQMLKNFYTYLISFFATGYLETNVHFIQSFVIWCDNNKNKIQEEYGIKINIEKEEKIWTLTISPYNTKIFGQIFKEFCEENEINAPYVEVGDDFGFRVIDVKRADAGNAFVCENEMYSSTEYNGKIYKEVIKSWVVPWYNINAHSYKYVRNGDRIKSVLADDSNLQFTVYQSNTIDKYIRLIMPKYKRRVEVEDLNRNFWTIGQVISAICSYLFDKNSPYATTFKSFLNEIMQLWENIMYLWVAAATIDSGKIYEEVHTEIVYCSMDENHSYLKYDDFIIENEGEKNLISYLDYLIQTYSEDNVIIIPVIRENNYADKYYGCELYPGLLWYDRNEKTTTWINFGASSGTWRSSDGIRIDVKNNTNIQKSIMGLLEQGKDYYWCQPMIMKNNDGDEIIYYSNSSKKSNYFYGGVRVVPNISYDPTVPLITLSLTLYDAAKATLSQYLKSEAMLGQIEIICEEGFVSHYSNSFTSLNLPSIYENGDEINPEYAEKIVKGWDLGEFPSCRIQCKVEQYFIWSGSIAGKPISINFSSNQETFEMDSEYYQATLYSGQSTVEAQKVYSINDVIDFTSKCDNVLLKTAFDNGYRPKNDKRKNGIYVYTVQHPSGVYKISSNELPLLSEKTMYNMIPADSVGIIGSLGDGTYDTIKSFYQAGTQTNTYQTITNTELNNSNKNSQVMNAGAIIYGPSNVVQDGYKTYSGYSYYTKIPSSLEATYNNKLVHFLYSYEYGPESIRLMCGVTEEQFFIYVKKGQTIGKDNWVIRYTQADGGSCPIRNTSYLAYYYTLKTPFSLSDKGSEAKDYLENPWSMYYQDRGIICQIKTSIFRPLEDEVLSEVKRRLCWDNVTKDFNFTYTKTGDDISGIMEELENPNEYELYYGQDAEYDFYHYNNNGKSS